MDNKIKAVLFDIDNTLYDYDLADQKAKEALYEYCTKHFAWTKKEAKEYLQEAKSQIEIHTKQILGRDTAVIHNRLIRFQRMLENKHCPLIPHAMALYNIYWDNLFSSMQVSEGMLDYIEDLKQKGIKIGIATDMTAQIQFRKLEKLSILPFVDFMVTSEEAGCEKPEKAFYELCIQKANCLPEECLMIGDSLKKDVLGAKAVGMHALQYQKGIIMTIRELEKMACEVRKGIIDGVHAAKAGHPGGSLSAADVFTYLYFEEMKVDPANPKDENRDRFVLSKGHTAPGLYAALAHRGFFPVEDLLTLRQIGSHLQGHPCIAHTPGIDMATGSLGQGISTAVGMAIAAKLKNKDYRVFTLLGDGELQEGQVWEASMLASHRKLDNLVVIVDNNGLQIDGNIEDVCSPYPIDEKFEAFGFKVIKVADGNDMVQLKEAFDEAKNSEGKPVCIVMKTVKGKGVSFMENQASWHGSAPNDEQYAVAMEDLKKMEEALCQK